MLKPIEENDMKCDVLCTDVDWEERHFQIVLSLLRNNESPLWVIEKADTIINLLKARHGTYEQ